ncbi:unnamed protein product [Nezara viridula]|nr:unnamed protein product [Nezara viridula]CAH1397707.1 unnamed protein product [Nezara viridula]
MVRSYSPMCTLASSMCLSEVEESCAAALPFRTPKRGRASLMAPNSHVSPIVGSYRFLPSRSPTANIHRYQWSGPTARCVPWPPQCALARWRSPVQPLSHSVHPKGAEHP